MATAKKNTSNSAEVLKRLEEFIGYFVEEFEAKLIWLVNILEMDDKDGSSLIKDLISAATDAATLSPKGFIDLLGNRITEYITEKGSKKTSDRFCKLAYDFKKDPKPIRKVLIEGSVDIFQSYEAPFMISYAKFGDQTRAMQKFAKQAVHNIVKYYESLSEDYQKPLLTTETLTKGVVHNVNSTFQTFDSILTYNKTVNINSKNINTNKLYHKVGVVIEEENGLIFYKNDESKCDKYGFRRLFRHEVSNKASILLKYVVIKQVQFNYKFVFGLSDIERLSEKLFVKINEEDPNLEKEHLMKKMDSISKDVAAELSNGILLDLQQNMGVIEDVLKKMMSGLNDLQTSQNNPPSKYNISYNNNNVKRWTNMYM